MKKIKSKIVPFMFAEIKKWIDEKHFIAICNEREILCHKDYWCEI